MTYDELPVDAQGAVLYCHHCGSEWSATKKEEDMPKPMTRSIAHIKKPSKNLSPDLQKMIARHAMMRQGLEWLLPLATAFLKHAPSHPDHAKLETIRMLLREMEG